MSVKILPYMAGTLPHLDITRSKSDKLQNASKRKKCQDFGYISPKVTNDGLGVGDDTSTLGENCHRRPHPNQHPGTHDRLQEVSFAYFSGSSMEELHHSIGRFQGNPVTHPSGDNIKGVHN